jgi:hypothetical protein
MKEQAYMEIAACSACQTRIRSKQKPAAAEHIEKGRPLKMWSTDFLGPYTAYQGQSVVVAIDNFLKLGMARVVPGQTAENFIKFLKDQSRIYGIPEFVLSDNGSAFLAEATQKFYEDMGIQGRRSAPGNPQGNGIAEKFVQAIKNKIRQAHGSRKTLDEIVKDAVFAYNTTPHESTGMSPFFMTFHRHPVLPLDWLLVEQREGAARAAAEEGVMERLRGELDASVRLQVRDAKQDQRLHKEGKIDAARVFQIGDRVNLLDEKVADGVSSRLKGPFSIVGMAAANTYILEGPNGVLARGFNVRMLAPYLEPAKDFKVRVDGPHGAPAVAPAPAPVRQINVEVPLQANPAPQAPVAPGQPAQDQRITLRQLRDDPAVPEGVRPAVRAIVDVAQQYIDRFDVLSGNGAPGSRQALVDNWNVYSSSGSREFEQVVTGRMNDENDRVERSKATAEWIRNNFNKFNK